MNAAALLRVVGAVIVVVGVVGIGVAVSPGVAVFPFVGEAALTLGVGLTGVGLVLLFDLAQRVGGRRPSGGARR
jgi:hypothetical protein